MRSVEEEEEEEETTGARLKPVLLFTSLNLRGRACESV